MQKQICFRFISLSLAYKSNWSNRENDCLGKKGFQVKQQSREKYEPLVSIMIPTYGQEEVILKAVDSALAQDYPNLEIIVADDASPDCTSQLVATRKDPRLHYHRNPTNIGRVANYRNT